MKVLARSKDICANMWTFKLYGPVFLGGQIHIIWICLRNLSMNLQNVPCVANQQLSDAQDVKLSGTVKGINYFLSLHVEPNSLLCLLVHLWLWVTMVSTQIALLTTGHLWHRINTEKFKELYKTKLSSILKVKIIVYNSKKRTKKEKLS